MSTLVGNKSRTECFEVARGAKLNPIINNLVKLLILSSTNEVFTEGLEAMNTALNKLREHAEVSGLEKRKCCNAERQCIVEFRKVAPGKLCPRNLAAWKIGLYKLLQKTSLRRNETHSLRKSIRH